MPYITKLARKSISYGRPPETAGELNYVITKILLDYLGVTPGYSQFNEVVGVLECIKLEMYRRMVVPYEEKKLNENGDVY